LDLVEDPADAAIVLLNSLRVLALAPAEQIALFSPHCTACLVRNTFDKWEQRFAESHFVAELTPQQQEVLQRIRTASNAVSRDPKFECNEDRYVQQSPLMADVRAAALSGLASFNWSAGPPELAYVYGTNQCADRLEGLNEQRRKERLAKRRMKPVVSQFHAATFQLHEHPLRANRSRLGEIEAWEAKHGMQLPAAVREWHLMEGLDLWARIRSRDAASSLDEMDPLRPALVRSVKPGEDDEPFFMLHGNSDTDVEVVEIKDAYSYLCVSADTDVGIPCLVRIDGSDDPSVFILREGEQAVDLTSPRFSVFQFDQLADAWFSYSWDDLLRLELHDRLPNAEELALLRAAFTEGPQSSGGWPGWHYRFFRKDVLVACGHDFYKQPAEVPFWEIRAKSKEAMLAVIRELRPIANLWARLQESGPPIADLWQ
jgi:hypothetical protein